METSSSYTGVRSSVSRDLATNFINVVFYHYVTCGVRVKVFVRVGWISPRVVMVR